MPKQKPGQSRQDYGTPRRFLDAVERRFGPMAVDLASTPENAKAPSRVDGDSLLANWSLLSGNLWLNPPFADIAPWARKCYEEVTMQSEIYLLVPASVGTNWFRDWVFQKAYVMFLSPRLTFEGCSDPYPKDLMLCRYGSNPGFECWRWDRE